LLARVQVDPLKPLSAAPGNNRLSKLTCGTTTPKRGLNVHAVNPGTPWRWVQPPGDPLDDFEGRTAARFRNPGMPSALRDGGAKIRFQGRKHPIYGCLISVIRLLGHGAPITQEQGHVCNSSFTDCDGIRCSFRQGHFNPSQIFAGGTTAYTTAR
jgi:hypothetical protein